MKIKILWLNALALALIAGGMRGAQRPEIDSVQLVKVVNETGLNFGVEITAQSGVSQSFFGGGYKGWHRNFGPGTQDGRGAQGDGSVKVRKDIDELEITGLNGNLRFKISFLGEDKGKSVILVTDKNGMSQSFQIPGKNFGIKISKRPGNPSVQTQVKLPAVQPKPMQIQPAPIVQQQPAAQRGVQPQPIQQVRSAQASMGQQAVKQQSLLELPPAQKVVLVNPEPQKPMETVNKSTVPSVTKPSSTVPAKIDQSPESILKGAAQSPSLLPKIPSRPKKPKSSQDSASAASRGVSKVVSTPASSTQDVQSASAPNLVQPVPAPALPAAEPVMLTRGGMQPLVESVKPEITTPTVTETSSIQPLQPVALPGSRVFPVIPPKIEQSQEQSTKAAVPVKSEKAEQAKAPKMRVAHLPVMQRSEIRRTVMPIPNKAVILQSSEMRPSTPDLVEEQLEQAESASGSASSRGQIELKQSPKVEVHQAVELEAEQQTSAGSVSQLSTESQSASGQAGLTEGVAANLVRDFFEGLDESLIFNQNDIRSYLKSVGIEKRPEQDSVFAVVEKVVKLVNPSKEKTEGLPDRADFENQVLTNSKESTAVKNAALAYFDYLKRREMAKIGQPQEQSTKGAVPAAQGASAKQVAELSTESQPASGQAGLTEDAAANLLQKFFEQFDGKRLFNDNDPTEYLSAQGINAGPAMDSIDQVANKVEQLVNPFKEKTEGLPDRADFENQVLKNSKESTAVQNAAMAYYDFLKRREDFTVNVLKGYYEQIDPSETSNLAYRSARREKSILREYLSEKGVKEKDEQNKAIRIAERASSFVNAFINGYESRKEALPDRATFERSVLNDPNFSKSEVLKQVVGFDFELIKRIEAHQKEHRFDELKKEVTDVGVNYGDFNPDLIFQYLDSLPLGKEPQGEDLRKWLNGKPGMEKEVNRSDKVVVLEQALVSLASANSL